jgi:uncharacterized protein (TIGR02757 family)
MTKLNNIDNLKDFLEDLYYKYNRIQYVHPDPLEFLYDYSEIKDREIVGLIASSLAYGRVAQILKSISGVLAKMDNAPFDFILNSSGKSLEKAFSGFVHRFAKQEHLCGFILGIKQIIIEYGSLQKCFLRGMEKSSETIFPGLIFFANEMIKCASYDPGHLMPLPSNGSASKRLNLFLRWMVRKDNVDPGGWDEIPASKLLVPLDVHMHKLSKVMRFTERKQANLKTALEITNCFKKFAPDDPVKYDFALTRFGIRKDFDFNDFVGNINLIDKNKE